MKIEVYGTPTCGNCKKVVNFLTENNVEHDYKTVNSDISVEELTDVIGRVPRTVPVIVVDGSEEVFGDLKTMVGGLG